MNLEEEFFGEKNFDISSILNIGKIGIWKLEEKSGVWYFKGNSVVGHLFGEDTREVFMSLEAFLSTIHEEDKDKVRKELFDVLKNGGTYNSEYRIYNKKHKKWRYVYVFGMTNNEKFIVGGIQDIEDKLVLNDRNNVKQSLKYMSHEIRTPINNIIGIIQLLNKTEITTEQQGYLDKTYQSANVLLNIANNVLDFSKIEAGKIEMEEKVFSIKGLIGEVSNIIHAELTRKKLKLSIKWDSKIQDIVQGDELRLKQILLNLLSNAIKFTKTGTISIEVVQKEKQFGKTSYLFSVKDTGIGIPSEEIEFLFDPYKQIKNSETTESNGIGLGLAISKSLVKFLDGDIWCESILGEGSIFSFTIKLVSAKKDNFSHRGLVNSKILLVDDNEINTILVKEILEMEGVIVDTAVNGVEALEFIYSDKNYDLVLMDIQMPKLDGIDTAKEIRKNISYNELPIIAMSASITKNDIQISLNAGINSYISKPINPNELYRNIERLINLVLY